MLFWSSRGRQCVGPGRPAQRHRWCRAPTSVVTCWRSTDSN